MAVSALTRITGTVLRVDRMQGVSRNSGDPYDFTQAKVLVADTDVTEVTLPRDLSHLRNGVPVKGEEIDWLVDFRVNSSGRGLSGNVLQEFPVSAASELV